MVILIALSILSIFLISAIVSTAQPLMVVELDGVVGEQEYQNVAEFANGDFILYWTVEGDQISMAMTTDVIGYLAIGFDPDLVMRNADVVLGYVTPSGAIHVEDRFSTGTFGPHLNDTALGGTFDLLDFNGSNSEGSTIIEFRRALNTGDEFDKPIPTLGIMDIIWAFGTGEDAINEHPRVGSGSIDLGTGGSSEDLELWPFHVLTMTVGAVLLLTSVGMLYVRKSVKKWYQWHKRLGTAGVVLIVLGLMMAIYMVEGAHLKVDHSYAGLATIILLLLPIPLAFATFKVKDHKRMRKVHIWVSRAGLVAVAITVALGLAQVL